MNILLIGSFFKLVPSIVAVSTLIALAVLLERLGWSRYCMLCLELMDLWSSSADNWRINEKVQMSSQWHTSTSNTIWSEAIVILLFAISK